jgi:hypothetical protein
VLFQHHCLEDAIAIKFLEYGSVLLQQNRWQCQKCVYSPIVYILWYGLFLCTNMFDLLPSRLSWHGQRHIAASRNRQRRRCAPSIVSSTRGGRFQWLW